MSLTPPTLRLHGTPCTVCWQPAREVVMFRDVHVVVHAGAVRQEPCRIPAPPAPEQPLLEPSARRAARFDRPLGRPVIDVQLPGGER